MADLSCGIVGLPNVGKSTLFNAITSNVAASSNYPFCTIDPNMGIVEVLDPRMPPIAEIESSKKILYAPLQFFDIAGLVKGASKGEGLGNKFLAHIRETDAIIHVVRCFESQDVIHVDGKVDPVADVEVINLELILADLQMVENTLARLEKQVKGNRELAPTIAILSHFRDHLNKNQLMRSLELTEEERKVLKLYPFLTAKKVLYVANVAEDDLPEMDNPYVRALREYADKEGSPVIPISAKIEQEIAQLPLEERAEFLESIGLEESGLQRIVREAFTLLDLIVFFTAGEMETRAWTLRKGMCAQEAAGKIHTDIQKGFIRAEVVTVKDYLDCKGRVGARDMGKARSEGKEYEVVDGDIILFLHN